MTSRITILAIRIRSRAAKEVWAFAKMMAGFSAVIALVGACQLGFCKYRSPKKPVIDCVAPLFRER
jgi:hypothetical protein